MKRNDYKHYKDEIEQIMRGKHPFNLSEKFHNGLECLGAVKRFYDSCDNEKKKLLRETIIEMLDSAVLKEKKDAIGLSEELKIEETIPKLLEFTTALEILDDVYICITLASALGKFRVKEAKPFFLRFLHHFEHPEAFDWRNPDRMNCYIKENPSIHVTPISLVGLVSIDLDAAIEYIRKFLSWDIEIPPKNELGFYQWSISTDIYSCFCRMLEVYGEESLDRFLRKVKVPDIASKQEFIIDALKKALDILELLEGTSKWLDDKKKEDLIDKVQKALS